jgi:AmpD protein
MHIDAARGRIRGVAFVPSPNFDARPAGMEISLLVVHAISLPPGEFGGPWVEDLFCNRLDPAAHPYFEEIRELRVSAHAFIGRDGSLTQFVSLLDRAWHAGVSSFEGRSRCNDFSIGVELEGTDEAAYEEVQYEALAALARALMRVYPAITPERIVGHSDVSPGRKTDPGPAFDWQRLRRRLRRHR